jgi:hypothetical protein
LLQNNAIPRCPALAELFQLLHIKKYFYNLFNRPRREAQCLNGIAAIERYAAQRLPPLPERQLFRLQEILILIGSQISPITNAAASIKPGIPLDPAF